MTYTNLEKKFVVYSPFDINNFNKQYAPSVKRFGSNIPMPLPLINELEDSDLESTYSYDSIIFE